MSTSNRRSRDNQYYLNRLAHERPDIYADLQSGKISSAAKALDLAGIKRQRTPLQQLMSAWKKASAPEKDAFKAQIGCVASGLIATPSLSPVAIHVERQLTPAAVAEIGRVMKARGLKMGQVMDELGFPRLNPSLGNALSRGTRVDKKMIEAIEAWLGQHTEP